MEDDRDALIQVLQEDNFRLAEKLGDYKQYNINAHIIFAYESVEYVIREKARSVGMERTGSGATRSPCTGFYHNDHNNNRIMFKHIVHGMNPAFDIEIYKNDRLQGLHTYRISDRHRVGFITWMDELLSHIDRVFENAQ